MELRTGSLRGMLHLSFTVVSCCSLCDFRGGVVSWLVRWLKGTEDEEEEEEEETRFKGERGKGAESSLSSLLISLSFPQSQTERREIHSVFFGICCRKLLHGIGSSDLIDSEY